MITALMNEAFYDANEESIRALPTTIGSWQPTRAYVGLVGLRGKDISSLVGINIASIESSGVSGQDEDGNDIPETTAEWSARTQGETVSNINKVVTPSPFNVMFLDNETDLHMLKKMTGFPNKPGEA